MRGARQKIFAFFAACVIFYVLRRRGRYGEGLSQLPIITAGGGGREDAVSGDDIDAERQQRDARREGNDRGQSDGPKSHQEVVAPKQPYDKYAVTVPSSLSSPSFAESETPGGTKIGKVSMLYGDPHPIYERALATHEYHANRWNYPMLVCRRPLLDGMWTKPACVLSMLLAELLKPEEERLEWLL